MFNIVLLNMLITDLYYIFSGWIFQIINFVLKGWIISICMYLFMNWLGDIPYITVTFFTLSDLSSFRRKFFKYLSGDCVMTYILYYICF